MLFLLFRLGSDRYVIEAAQISEVLPLIAIKTLPQAPPGVAGVINLRGAPVPVIDLIALTLGRPALPRLSTRIVVASYQAPDGAPRPLALIVEQATEIMSCQPSDFVAAGIASPTLPWLGPVVPDPRGLIQRVDLARLLPHTVRDLLFRTLADAD
jgi:chemotaxis-related protein WspB